MNIDHTLIADRQAGMVLCTAGSRKAIINGQAYHIQPGMLCIVSPMVMVYDIERSDDYAELQLIDDVDVFYQVVRLVYDTILSLHLRNSPCLMLDEENIRLFTERVATVNRKRDMLATVTDTVEQRLLRHVIRKLMQATMIEVIHLYYRNRTVSPVNNVKHAESVVLRFMTSLNLNYRTERSVSFYAREANLSQSHFTRLIKQRTGRPPSEWIITVTLLNAKMLLLQSDMSIKEIAAKLHFPEQFTFRKFFKLYAGMPPKEYRQLIKRGK